ncbi:MAG: hypothetical protein M1834_009108 [Cirrosporium novae-zelandiae]|nr:MAG: hypothetical protein M1834_009108 [Cirrosporium novae-zelandiae]
MDAALAVKAPIDPKEQPILDQLIGIRDKLLVHKQDKSTYIKSRDIIPIFDECVEQLRLLTEIRPALAQTSQQQYGRNNEAPAIYSITSTLKRLVDHLKESGVFSSKDLESGLRTLESMECTMQRGKGTYAPEFLVLIQRRLDICRSSTVTLLAQLEEVSRELLPTHERLVSILRSISSCNTRQKFPVGEVKAFQDQLRQMEATMVDGKFIGENGTIPHGQELVGDLLKRCLYWSDMVLERKGKIDEQFKEPYDKLCDVRNQLEKLSLTQAWSLRETDLWSYQQTLDQIDESRVDGNFLGSDGKPAELHAQRTLLYLLRRSYAYIYSLLISSEPVSEALQPVFNQLQTLRRCLIEVKKSGGVSNPRELYPYSMKLTSIDNMRVDGKFMVGSDIPEGQGCVNDLLAECFDLVYDLRLEAEDGADE